jgi:hypothetical protein
MGIARALSNYGHKQYPFNSLDQNNSIHGVYTILSWGYCFPSRFELNFFGVKKGFLVWVQDLNYFFDNFIKHAYKNMWECNYNY